VSLLSPPPSTFAVQMACSQWKLPSSPSVVIRHGLLWRSKAISPFRPGKVACAGRATVEALSDSATNTRMAAATRIHNHSPTPSRKDQSRGDPRGRTSTAAETQPAEAVAASFSRATQGQHNPPRPADTAERFS
jgi:hypothetical protein